MRPNGSVINGGDHCSSVGCMAEQRKVEIIFCNLHVPCCLAPMSNDLNGELCAVVTGQTRDGRAIDFMLALLTSIVHNGNVDWLLLDVG